MRSRPGVHLTALMLAILPAAHAAGMTPEPGPPCYKSYLAGNADDARVAESPGGGVVLMGGGEKLADAFRFMIARMGGGGDFLVIRHTDYNTYTEVVWPLGGIDSVEELVIPSRTCAADPYVQARLAGAEAIFISGGDQSNYVNDWAGTPVTAALDQAMARGIPVGGTSAGDAVLGQFVYSAQHADGTDSAQALADPFDPTITLVRDFLRTPYLSGIISDQHFVARNRFGRLAAFLARLKTNGWLPAADAARAIAVDEDTAFLLETDGLAAGTGHVIASAEPLNRRAVYMVSTPATAPEACRQGEPLTYKHLRVHRLEPGQAFDLTTWTGNGTGYEVSVDAGVLVPAAPY